MGVDVSGFVVHVGNTSEAVEVGVGDGPVCSLDVFVVLGPFGQLGPGPEFGIVLLMPGIRNIIGIVRVSSIRTSCTQGRLHEENGLGGNGKDVSVSQGLVQLTAGKAEIEDQGLIQGVEYRVCLNVFFLLLFYR